VVETIKIEDKHNTPMEMFLLAAISRGGLNTLYALQGAAGLQPGSLAPVIRNLVEAGFLVRSESGKRGRRVMALTDSGERLLAEEWKNGLDTNREIESILRSATVALLMSDIGTAIGFLFASASERRPHLSPRELGEIPLGMAPSRFLAEWRAVYENRRREMEAAVLQEFGTNLAKFAQNLHLN
jgi:DNA-binding MarR family transcriptional regulator